MTSDKAPRAPVHVWAPDSLPAEVKGRIDRLAMTEGVRHIAIMPDVHLAHELCVGSVIATEGILLPGAIGGDIGCGMAAMRFNGEASILAGKETATQVMTALYETIPTIRHSRKAAPDLPSSIPSTLTFDDGTKALEKDGKLEFATLGSGNHFLEFQADEEGMLWLMVHSGSRAMGQIIAAHHAKKARKTSTGFHVLDRESDEGRAFLADLDWAMIYARESRRAILKACAGFMRALLDVEADVSSYVDCVHNFLRLEAVSGSWFHVHRKGAISVRDGETGMVPGSMGTPSFHVVGRGCEAALFSSAHGAGRTCSRSDARRKIAPRAFLKSMDGIWFDHRRSQHLIDEAPDAYKDIHAVMRAQHDLVRIVRRLRPVLNFKGSA